MIVLILAASAASPCAGVPASIEALARAIDADRAGWPPDLVAAERHLGAVVTPECVARVERGEESAWVDELLSDAPQRSRGLREASIAALCVMNPSWFPSRLEAIVTSGEGHLVGSWTCLGVLAASTAPQIRAQVEGRLQQELEWASSGAVHPDPLGALTREPLRSVAWRVQERAMSPPWLAGRPALLSLICARETTRACTEELERARAAVDRANALTAQRDAAKLTEWRAVHARRALRHRVVVALILLVAVALLAFRDTTWARLLAPASGGVVAGILGMAAGWAVARGGGNGALGGLMFFVGLLGGAVLGLAGFVAGTLLSRGRGPRWQVVSTLLAALCLLAVAAIAHDAGQPSCLVTVSTGDVDVCQAPRGEGSE